MDKIDHIKQSLRNAEFKQSKLDELVIMAPGETGLKIKHLLNNITNFEGCNYLEVDVNRSATLTSALYNNKVNDAYAIMLTNNDKEILFLKDKFNISVEHINEDCFKVDLSKFKNKINVYLYNGDHSYESHYKSLEYFYPILDDEFIFMVNDWVGNLSPYFEEWRQVSDATYDAIEKLNLKILIERHKMKSILEKQEDAWWGGFWVSLLKK